jgi:hypothetical protein
MSADRSIDAMVRQTARALSLATDGDRQSLGALTLHILALHGRLQRALCQLPQVVGDDVPWAAIGDRDLYVASVAAALSGQRRRISQLSDLRDPTEMLAACRMSLQTLEAVARDVTGFLPMPAQRRAA